MIRITNREIIAEIVRQEEKMGWPEMVPAFAEIRPNVWKKHGDLNLSDCEQIVEWRTRVAVRALFGVYHGLRDARTVRRAAKNVLLARLYRCQYYTLLGKNDVDPGDMPFVIGEETIREAEEVEDD